MFSVFYKYSEIYINSMDSVIYKYYWIYMYFVCSVSYKSVGNHCE